MIEPMTGPGVLDAIRERRPNPLARLLSIADIAGDDDDARLRKRVGIVAGLVTIVAPLPLTVQGEMSLLAWVLAIAMSTFSAANVVLLARSRNFERFVTLLLISGVVFVPVATAVGGGITGSTSGLVFAFLIPAFAMMALGPRRATWWFAVFLVVVVAMVVVDPIVHDATREPPYPLQLTGVAINTLLPLTVVFLLLRHIDLRRRAAEARVDELLTNAIPASIAARLKTGETRIAESYPETTVLFADIVGFTAWTQRTDPARVVALLDNLFTRFDELAAQHGVEKIKSIGDSYMAVAGAPEPRSDHAPAALAMARDMLGAVAAWCRANDLPLDLRIGLASGPVVAGVIGLRRILFDLWGDTVNVAARMESSGEPGRVQLAESTWSRLTDKSGLVQRHADVKDLGRVSTFVTDGHSTP